MEAIKFSELPTGDRMPLGDEDGFPIIASNENRLLTFGRLKNQIATQTHTDEVKEEEKKVPTAEAVEKRVRSAEAKTEAFEERITANEQGVAEAKEKNQTQDTEISDLQSRMESAESDIEAADEKNTEQDRDIAEIKSRLDTAEGDITAEKSKNETQDTQISGLTERLNSTDTNVSEAQSKNSEQDSAIQKLQSDFEDLSKQPGPMGPAGPRGDDGAPGADGQPGKDGANGKDGITPHIDEASGNWFIGDEDTGVHAEGPQGQKGDRGERGEQGLRGEQGEPGEPGAQGPEGPAGKDGERGPEGPQGQPGKDGAKGEKGDPGEPGADGVPGERGPKGEDGAPGENGKDGANGKDGITPHIDEASGNWFIGEQDTGVKAQGPQGPKGDAGAKGDKGEKGDTPDYQNKTLLAAYAPGVSTMTDFQKSADGLTLPIPTINFKTNKDDTLNLKFPVASESQAGIMTAAMFAILGKGGGAPEFWGYETASSAWKKITGSYSPYSYSAVCLNFADLQIAAFFGKPSISVSGSSSSGTVEVRTALPTTLPSFINQAFEIALLQHPLNSYANAQTWSSVKPEENFIKSVPVYFRQGSGGGKSFPSLHTRFEDGTWIKEWCSENKTSLSSCLYQLNYLWLVYYTKPS